MTGAQAIKPSVNIAVCGNFGQLPLVPWLARCANLQTVYYAAPLSTTASKLGVEKSQAQNLFLKEYLIQAHARYLRHMRADLFYPIYDKIWQRGVLHHWRPCNVLHAVTTGAVLPIVAQARSDGSAILGHPITCHPHIFREQLNREIDSLGVPPSTMFYPDNVIAAELSLCDRYFCLSTLVRDGMIARGIASDRIDVIPLPTNLDLFSPGPEQKSGPFRVICVAEISPIKGHIYLLEAWRRLRLTNAELIFAGVMRQEMMDVLKRYDGLFKYVGPLNKQRLIELYRHSSLLVLPSVLDGFGFVVSEALACGTPAVVTNQVGGRDIIQHGVNGYVVPARDVESLAQTIGAVHESHDLRKTLRSGAIATRASFPSIEQTAHALSRAYDRVAADRGSS